MADSATLYNIAQQNPLSGGKAVYDARAMLNINQDDFLSENNRYKLEEELMVSENNQEFLLFPNPNNGKFYLQHNLQNANTDAMLNIYDATGRVIKNMSLKLSDSITEIDITNITNGTYYCVICTSDGLKINAGKIVVIK